MIEVYSFRVGDLEDPDIYAASPLLKWEESEQGKWVMAHAIEPPVWHRQPDHMTYGYKYSIRAKLNKEDELYYKLKWGM